jgi:dUTP pyrophosphatase
MSKIVKCKIEENGQLPVKAHKSDAGFDLFAVQDFSVAPGQIVKQPVNVRLELPESTYAEITSKSGNGSKGLLVYAGIIDQGYRGVVHVVMTNLNQVPMDTHVNGYQKTILLAGPTLHFKKGQKIAQMILHPFSSEYELQEVDQLDENTSRSGSGFGSSGGSLV